MDSMFAHLARSPLLIGAPSPVILLDPDLRIRAANPAFLGATERRPEDVTNRPLFDAFPDNPELALPNRIPTLEHTLESVVRTASTQVIAPMRYDVATSRGAGEYAERTWTAIGSPLDGEDGRVAGILLQVDDLGPVAHLLEAAPGDERAQAEQLRRLARAVNGRGSALHRLQVGTQRLQDALAAVVASHQLTTAGAVADLRGDMWREVAARVTDDRWRGWTNAVCEYAVTTVVGVAGAAISAFPATAAGDMLAWSSEWTRRVEEAAFCFGEGPAPAADRQGLPVFAGDMRLEADRWPFFAAAATKMGVKSALSFPLTMRHSVIGVLSLYSRGRSCISDHEFDMASLLADLGAVAVIADLYDAGAGAAICPGTPGFPLRHVHAAVGVLMTRLGVDAEDALALLRARAFAQDRPLGSLASRILEEIEVTDLSPGDDL